MEELGIIAPPVADGYVIRIIEPTTVVSSLETRVYHTPEECEEPIRQVQEKFARNGIEEYVIHLISQSTGAVLRTVRRVVRGVGVVEEG